MWISRRNYNKTIDRYEKRIDDLLNRLMSNNFSEYKFVKGVPIEDQLREELKEVPEPLSRTDEDEYLIEQKRLNDMKELEGRAEVLKQEMYK